MDGSERARTLRRAALTWRRHPAVALMAAASLVILCAAAVALGVELRRERRRALDERLARRQASAAALVEHDPARGVATAALNLSPEIGVPWAASAQLVRYWGPMLVPAEEEIATLPETAVFVWQGGSYLRQPGRAPMFLPASGQVRSYAVAGQLLFTWGGGLIELWTLPDLGTRRELVSATSPPELIRLARGRWLVVAREGKSDLSETFALVDPSLPNPVVYAAAGATPALDQEGGWEVRADGSRFAFKAAKGHRCANRRVVVEVATGREFPACVASEAVHPRQREHEPPGLALQTPEILRFPATRAEDSRWEPLAIGEARALPGEENASIRMEAELLAIAAERAAAPARSAPGAGDEPTATQLAGWGTRLRAPDLAGACGEWRLPRFSSEREPLNLRDARVVCSGRGGLTTIAVDGGQAARWYEVGCWPSRGEDAGGPGHGPCAQVDATDWGGATAMFAIGPSLGLAGFFDGGTEDSLTLLDLETMREVEHEDALPVCAMAFDAPTGRVAFVGGGRLRVARYDRRSGALTAIGSVRVQDAPPEGPEWEAERCPLGGSSSGGGTGIGAPIAFLPGDRIALLNGSSLTAIDLRTGDVVWTQASAHFGTRLAVWPDGDVIAVWSREALQLFSAFDGAPLSPALTAESDPTEADRCATSQPCVVVETVVADGIALVVPQRDGAVVALTKTGHLYRRQAPAPLDPVTLRALAGPSRTGLSVGTAQAASVEVLPGVQSR